MREPTNMTTPTKTIRALGLATVLTLLASGGARAEEQVVSTSLAHEGQLVSLISGTYGEMFPGGSEAEADVTVLALRRTLPDGRQILEVVPATLDQDTEEDAELVVEPVSGVSYVFWQSWTNLIHCRLLVSSFDGQTWSEPIQVSGSAFAWRTSPAFAVTRDSFTDVTADGTAISRTILHILWSEEGDDGYWETKYAPLVLENGVYIGNHPTLVLNDLVERGSGSSGTDLRIAPALRARDDNGVVAAFLDQPSGRIAAVELKFAAGELSILGDTVAAEVEQAAAKAPLSSKYADDLVAAVRARLLSYGDHLKPELLGSLASELDRHLRDRLSAAPGDVASIRDGARAQVIDVGFRLTDGRVRRATAVARAQVIDVGARGDGPRRHRHDARSSVAGSTALPEVPSAPETLVSTGGDKLMLVWREADRIRYQESKADGGWTAVQQIRLTDQLDYDQAMDVLQRRIEQQ